MVHEFLVSRDPAVPVLLRQSEVTAHTGLSESGLQRLIAAGLFTKPVNLSIRARAWPRSEVSAFITAKIAGMPDGDLRKLVSLLHAKRGQPSELSASVVEA